MPKTKTPKSKAKSAPKAVAAPNTYAGPTVTSLGEPLRVALVGAGGIAATHYRGYLAAKASVVAFVEPNEVTRLAREREWGVKGYAGLEALLQNESVEAVSVCSPNAFHHGATLAAARAGLHVLCEKPLSMSLAECREMIEAARKAKVVLQTGHHLRSNLLVEKTKEIIASGQIGKVTFMRLRQAHDWGGNKAVRESFGLLKNSGGGTLLDNGCHMMDLARHFGGEVRRVSALMGTLGTWTTRVEVEDTSVVALEFAGGVLGSVENAWTATGWEEGWWIYGTEGAVECTNRLGRRTLRHVRRDSLGTTWDKVDETLFSYADEGGHPRQIVAFIRSIREGAPVVCTGQDGMESVRLVLSAYESAKKGKPVEL